MTNLGGMCDQVEAMAVDTQAEGALTYQEVVEGNRDSEAGKAIERQPSCSLNDNNLYQKAIRLNDAY